MDETNEVETGSDATDEVAGEFLTTAVVFGAGALSAALLPRIYRGARNSATNVRDRVKDRVAQRKLAREQNTEEK